MPTPLALIDARRAAGVTAVEQVCRTCVTLKPASEYRRNWRRVSCLEFDCHDCVSHANRLFKFGLTVQAHAEMLEAQGHVCAICSRPEKVIDPRNGRPKALAVDHDHETGAIRGLLCQNCNKGIGNLGDSPETLIAAAAYLIAARGGE